MLDLRDSLGSKEITQIDIPKGGISRVISYIYYGANLVWQAVRSCFGSGVWIPEKPWLPDEAWKYNNK